jgi:hypothetical protein
MALSHSATRTKGFSAALAPPARNFEKYR